jgi:hypothetical protein
MPNRCHRKRITFRLVAYASEVHLPAGLCRAMQLVPQKSFAGRREGEERVDRLPIWLLAEKLTCGC